MAALSEKYNYLELVVFCYEQGSIETGYDS